MSDIMNVEEVKELHETQAKLAAAMQAWTKNYLQHLQIISPENIPSTSCLRSDIMDNYRKTITTLALATLALNGIETFEQGDM